MKQALQYDSGKYYYIPQYPLNGYATGNYQCRCSKCKELFIGDKRAVICFSCSGILSTRIEVAPESLVFANQIIGNSLDIEPVNKKLTSSDYWVFEFPEGIYPVQVKLEIIKVSCGNCEGRGVTDCYTLDGDDFTSMCLRCNGKMYKQYAILSEINKE